MRRVKIDRKEIFAMIEAERERQERLHPMEKQKKNLSFDVHAVHTMLLSSELLAVLVEEIGEVASAVQGDGSLKDELVQVASVAVRWLELINENSALI